MNISEQVINGKDENGQSALHWSIIKGNIESAEYIIELGADVNTATNESDVEFPGTTPLIRASALGYISVVKKLIESGANISATQENGDHAAMLAVKYNHLDILMLLINHEPNSATQKGYEGMTPLIYGAINGYLQIVEYLSSLPQTNIDSQSSDGSTALIWAVFNNQTEIVRFLAQNGGNLSIITEYGNNALDYAVNNNHLEIVEILLMKGADPLIQGRNGNTALHSAAKNGYLDIVKFILGKNFNSSNLQGYNGRTPLSFAALYGNQNLVKYLISLPQINLDSRDKDGDTPLSLATYSNHSQIVEILLERGADPSVQNNNGDTALRIAATLGHFVISKLLIEKNSNVTNLKGLNKSTPLIAAAQNSHIDIVHYLASLPQTNLNSQDNDGFTALMWTAFNDHPETVNFLLQKGADPSIKDSEGNNALYWARYKNNVKVIEILKQYT